MAMIWKHSRNRMRDFTLLYALLFGAQAQAQELVYSTGNDFGSSGLVVIPNLAGGLAASSPIYVDPLGGITLNSHGLTLVGPTTAVATHMPTNTDPDRRVDVIDIATASLSASFYPGGASDTDYSGSGTAIINPAGTHLLLAAGRVPLGAASSLLWVVPTPLSSLSVASDILTMPGKFGTAQTHAIAFDPATGRAYVAHTNGITVIDPPYHAGSIAFTIPLPAVTEPNGGLSRSVALSPDASTMLLTSGGATPGINVVTIVHAPFSASSTSEELSVEHASQLRAISFTPDGSQALAVDLVAPSGRAQVFAIAAPYNAASSVEWLQLPAGGQNLGGFEDIELSPDGQIAALAGGCEGDGCPLVALRAPFTASGFTVETQNIPLLAYPYAGTGRGAGTVHFWPTAVVPQPQIRIDNTTVTEGNSGARRATFTIRLSNPSAQTVTVDYATADAQAQEGSDYIATAGTLTFAPGQTRKTVDVDVIGDTLTESDEYFRLNISNPVNASMLFFPLGFDGLCLIINDDGGTPYIATDPPLPDAYVGVPYAQTFTAANTSGPLTWGVASPNQDLVGGLAMDGPSGVLSGVPVQAGSYDFSVYLAGLSTSREYHLNVWLDRIFANGFEAAP